MNRKMRDGHTGHYIAAPIEIGVDEAGRGPIAGPVTVAAVAFLEPFDQGVLKGVRDSKQLSEDKRFYYRSIIDGLQKTGAIRYAVRSSSARVIDARGIVPAVSASLAGALRALYVEPEACFVRLDGLLKAPPRFIYQETIIKGDERELSIMLAGIVAKTSRDRLMKRYARQYPLYGFDIHKGYGTKMHYQAIQTSGPCEAHRQTFLKA